jgi:uncharacterized protein HemX
MRIPWRRQRPEGDQEPTDAAPSEQATRPAASQPPAAPPPRPAPPGPGAAAAAGAPPPRPDPHERIDSQRAWIAQLDRRLGVRTYVLGALALLAAAAAVVALVLVIQLRRDAATDDDVNAIRNQLSGIQQSATSAAQKSVESVDQRLTDLESEVSRLSTGQKTTRRELQVVQDDIKELRSQASSAGAGGAASGGGVGAP